MPEPAPMHATGAGRGRWGRLLPADDAAEYLGISRSTVRELDLPEKRIGRRVLYDIRDLDQFVDRMGDALAPSMPTADNDEAARAAEEAAFFGRRAKRNGQD